MFMRYQKIRLENGSFRYRFMENVSLFGCRNGFIPRLLQHQTPENQNEPYEWHIDIEKALASTDEYRDSALIIDLKPKQSAVNLSLYEILDVWGRCNSGWTPMLLRLSGLFVDKETGATDRKDFTKDKSSINDSIYEVLYTMEGTIKDGKLSGKWNPPPASPTNAALLWPDTLKYFVKCIKEKTPGILGS